MFNSLTKSHTKQRSSRRIKSTGYNTRKNKNHPNLIGNFIHLNSFYKVYLFNKLPHDIIVATSTACEPDYPSEYLPDILSEENGNLFFLLVKNKYVIGFIM